MSETEKTPEETTPETEQPSAEPTDESKGKDEADKQPA